jgi:hypothetical protein
MKMAKEDEEDGIQGKKIDLRQRPQQFTVWVSFSSRPISQLQI